MLWSKSHRPPNYEPFGRRLQEVADLGADAHRLGVLLGLWSCAADFLQIANQLSHGFSSKIKTKIMVQPKLTKLKPQQIWSQKVGYNTEVFCKYGKLSEHHPKRLAGCYFLGGLSAAYLENVFPGPPQRMLLLPAAWTGLLGLLPCRQMLREYHWAQDQFGAFLPCRAQNWSLQIEIAPLHWRVSKW